MTGKKIVITKAQADAPNYKMSTGTERCLTCQYFQALDYCTEFDFTANPNWVCDNWHPRRSLIVRKGGVGSGNFAHAGRPGKIGGSATTSNIKYVNTPRDLTAVKQGHIFVSYYIDPNDKIIDIESYGHADYMRKVLRENEADLKAFGLDPNTLDVDIHAASVDLTAILGRAASAGTIQVFTTGDRIVIRTADINIKTLRRLQRLSDTDKLDFSPIGKAQAPKEFLWGSAIDPEISIINASMREFLSAKRVVLDEYGYPELKEFIRVVKGGAGSGNWGHAGRPGKVGGSMTQGAAMSRLTGKTAAKRAQKVRDLHKYDPMSDKQRMEWLGNVNMYVGDSEQEAGVYSDPQDVVRKSTGNNDITLEEFVHNTFEYSDPDTGMESKVDNITAHDGWFSVSGIVYDKDGSSAGNFTRHVFDDGEIHNDMFMMYKQGTGFGSDYYRRQEIMAAQAGIKKITLFADLTVGGYAWARLGYDTLDSVDMHTLKVALKMKVGEVAKRYDQPGKFNAAIDKMQHTWEIAAFTLPDGDRIGKSFMMGQMYDATKDLSPNSISSRVGQEYYKAKDKISK